MGVVLRWSTASEVNNYGFEILRSAQNDEESWGKIGFVQGNGTINSPKEYSFIDSDLPDANQVGYRLKQIDNDGTFAYSKVVSVDLATITGVKNTTKNGFIDWNDSTDKFIPAKCKTV